MVIRVICSLAVIILLQAYKLFQGSIESSIAANQLEDNQIQYGLSQFVATGGLEKVLVVCVVLALFVIWIPFLKQVNKKGETK